MVNSFYSYAQLNPSLPPLLGQAISAVSNAEAAGATPNETAPLVTLVNTALELNREASNLPSNQTQERGALLARVNQILSNVTDRANRLTTAAIQRTYTVKVIAYLTGLVVAILGTLAFSFGVEIYRRYYVKRTFQMRIRRR